MTRDYKNIYIYIYLFEKTTEIVVYIFIRRLNHFFLRFFFYMCSFNFPICTYLYIYVNVYIYVYKLSRDFWPPACDLAPCPRRRPVWRRSRTFRG